MRIHGLTALLLFAAPTAHANEPFVAPVNQEIAIAIESEVVRVVSEVYGANAVLDTSPGEEVPAAVIDAIQETQRVPDSVRLRPVPDRLEGRLPQTADGTTWHRLGDHLLEIDGNGRVLATVLEVLP
ncbi:MAG: hypothetical protein AAGE18_00140 [Pseudomonadota bacterium]